MCSSFTRFILQKCVRICWAQIFYFIVLVPTTSAVANTWTFQPGIDFGEIYSDNISRTTSRLAQDDFVTEVSPWLSVKNNARRLKLNLDYHLRNYFYANDSRRNKTYDQLDADSTAVFVENLFYFDADGSVGQHFITPETNVPFDNISGTSNRTNYTTYTLSPYIHHRFGASATADLRYGYNRVSYSAAGRLNSRADRYSARIQSGPSFSRVNWDLSYSRQNVIYDNYPSSTFKSAQGRSATSLLHR